MRPLGHATAALLFALAAVSATGCQVGTDRTATVAEPLPVATAAAESVSPLSEQEIEDLERELDEIDRLLSDAERAFDGA